MAYAARRCSGTLRRDTRRAVRCPTSLKWIEGWVLLLLLGLRRLFHNFMECGLCKPEPEPKPKPLNFFLKRVHEMPKRKSYTGRSSYYSSKTSPKRYRSTAVGRARRRVVKYTTPGAVNRRYLNSLTRPSVLGSRNIGAPSKVSSKQIKLNRIIDQGGIWDLTETERGTAVYQREANKVYYKSVRVTLRVTSSYAQAYPFRCMIVLDKQGNKSTTIDPQIISLITKDPQNNKFDVNTLRHPDYMNRFVVLKDWKGIINRDNAKSYRYYDMYLKLHIAANYLGNNIHADDNRVYFIVIQDKDTYDLAATIQHEIGVELISNLYYNDMY